jgi:hypothetical protein
MDKRQIKYGIIGIVTIILAGLVIAQTGINLGLPNAQEGSKIFEICDYNPNDIQVSWTIINETSQGLNTYREVQSLIKTDSGRCIKGYKFNFTQSNIAIPGSIQNTIEERIESFIINSAGNISITQTQNNYGQGGFSVIG